MSDNGTVSMNVVIGGINIPVKVRDGEKKQIGEIAAQINGRLNDIQIRYPDKKLEESLAMTVLSLMVQKHSESKTWPEQEELMVGFDQIEDLLDKLLK